MFLKGVAENIITMEKIVEITLFQFENFLKWLCLPSSSSVSDTAEMLETFCKHVNEATEEVLKDIANIWHPDFFVTPLTKFNALISPLLCNRRNISTIEGQK